MLKLLWKRIGLAAGLGLAMALFYGGGYVVAHGKEVNIAVTCIVPDAGRPLTQVCTAFLKYLDGDPVQDAHLELTAVREGSAEVSLAPVRFKPLDQEGLYSATVTFPAYGRWRIKFMVRGSDSGEAELVQELLPPVPGASPEIRARLQVVLNFGFADLRNIGLRVVHLLGSVSWFALSALALVLSLLPASQQRRRLLRRLGTVFPWGAAATLLIIGASGALSARYNAPTRAPGLFAPELFAGLPFGEAYLMTFAVKLALGMAIIGTTIALAVALRRAGVARAPMAAGGSVGSASSPGRSCRWVAWLAATNLLLGLLVFADVVVMGYLHILTHVAAAAGG